MQAINRSILHVDDDPLVTQLVAARLARHGFEVSSLNDPTQVIERLIHGAYRVVLLDIDMPEHDGIELLKQIKSYDGGIQVVMLTGLVTMSTALRSLRYGAEACIFKPLTDERPLVEALEDAVRKLQRWWNTLHELSHRRKDEQRVAAAR